MLSEGENHDITLAAASELTQNYRDAQTTSTYIKAEAFGKKALTDLLDQSGSIGMRVYYGLDNYGVPKLVLVGVDSYGNDMVNGKIMEMGMLCPPNCSEQNSLNTDPAPVPPISD